MIFLRKRREEIGMTRQVLGVLVGIHPQQIYNVEKGRAALPLKYVNKMAKVLKVRRSLLLSMVVKDKTSRMMGEF